MTLGSSFPEGEECGMEMVEVVEVDGFGVEFERKRESTDIMKRGGERASVLASWNGSGRQTSLPL